MDSSTAVYVNTSFKMKQLNVHVVAAKCVNTADNGVKDKRNIWCIINLVYSNPDDKKKYNKVYYERIKDKQPPVPRNAYWPRRRLENLIKAGIVEVEEK